MKVLFLFSFILSSTVMAVTGYDINFKLLKNGKSLTSSKVLAKEKEEARIQSSSKKHKTDIRVIASDQVMNGFKGVNLKLKVFHEGEGSSTIEFSPELFVVNDDEGRFEIIDQSNGDHILLNITAKKIKLN